MSNKKLGIILCLIIIIIGGCFAGIKIGRVMGYTKSDLRKEESLKLLDNFYGAFRLSLLPTEHLEKGEIEYYTGSVTDEVEYCFYNLKDVHDFLEEIYASQELVERVYLHLDPIEISKQYGGIAALYGRAYSEYLMSVAGEHPETVFECILPGYSVEYWSGMNTADMQEALSFIRDFYNVSEGWANVNVYYMGFEEWLIANAFNYVDTRLYNTDVNSLITAMTIRNDYYLLTRENLEERLSGTEQVVSDTVNSVWPDLSACDIVFIGDSVFGNYTDSLSIPGVVSAVSGARVYNCAQGGRTASADDSAVLTFETMVTYLLTGDITDLEDCTFKNGVQSYLGDDHGQRELYFIINFGLNDYFGGFPVENPADALDSQSYAGALRNGIAMLQEAYTEATIIMMCPNFITTFSNGTEIQGENGQVLEVYVNAAQQVATELSTGYLDVYYDAGYTPENAIDYLVDACHPNERGRYLLAWKIVEQILKESK